MGLLTLNLTMPVRPIVLSPFLCQDMYDHSKVGQSVGKKNKQKKPVIYTRKIFTFPIAVQITEIVATCQMLLCMMVGFPFQGQMEISFEFLGAGKS